MLLFLVSYLFMYDFRQYQPCITSVLHTRIYFVCYLIFQFMWNTCWWPYITRSPKVIWTTLLAIIKHNLQLHCLQITDFNFKLNSNKIRYTRLKSPEFREMDLHWLGVEPLSETVMLKQWFHIPLSDVIFICYLLKKAWSPSSAFSK